MSKPLPDLIVVTSARWLADDLAAQGSASIRYSMGLGVPEDAADAFWWCSSKFAARLAATGIYGGFLSAGPTFTADLPSQFLGRKVWAGPLGDLPAVSGPRFYKSAEGKYAGLPAAVHMTPGAFVRAARAVHLTNDSMVQVSTVVQFATEFRCFIAHGQVIATSVYLHKGETWESLKPGDHDTGRARDFAQAVVDHLGDNQPPGYVLDVGEIATTDGSPGALQVVEANAAWSAHPYHCGGAVVPAILASQSSRDRHARWRWRADPHLSTYAASLPLDTPVRTS